MPTYDYQCDGCGHEMELFQRITEDPIKKCPACNKNKLRRLFGTGAAIMFKGSGFYETDYRSESYKKGEQAAKQNSDSKKSESSKSESSKSESSGGSASKQENKSKSNKSSGNSNKAD